MYENPPIPRKNGAPIIGLALGSGAARGWSHIGVIRALAEQGIRPDVVCGSSIGALVGAAYVCERIGELEEWVSGLGWQDVVSMLDLSFRGGLIRGEKVLNYYAEHFCCGEFSEIGTPFACVATDLDSGREIWLRDGNLASAVRASMALPGLFSPHERAGRVLVDGGLVNPVPVSLCRALGADIVIAVELGSGILGLGTQPQVNKDAEAGITRRLLNSIGLNPAEKLAESMPSFTDVLVSSINIMQMRIARSRLAGEPADVLISPRVAQLSMMDFHRAPEAIEAGVSAVARAHESLMLVLGRE